MKDQVISWINIMDQIISGFRIKNQMIDQLFYWDKGPKDQLLQNGGSSYQLG